jgi:hypothetical protein
VRSVEIVVVPLAKLVTEEMDIVGDADFVQDLITNTGHKMLSPRSIKGLLSKRKASYSQSGEDGLLEFVLSQISQTDGWCVEFGAWDGMHLSNTFHLIKTKNYKAVLIEMDPDKYATLAKNMAPYHVTCINKMVGISGDGKLDAILSETEVPPAFDLLSIDIDGNDYHVWKSLTNYVPKVVIIEINYTDKPGVERINPPESPFLWGVSGSSIQSMTDLAHSKGYSLIANIGCNAVYVRKEYLSVFHKAEPTPDQCFTYEGVPLSKLSAAELYQKISLLGVSETFARVAKRLSRTSGRGVQ